MRGPCCVERFLYDAPGSGHASRITFHPSRSLRQQLRYVHRLRSYVLPAQSSGYMHQAADVARDDHVCAALFDALDLVLKYAAGYLRILDREQSSEPAASLRALELDQFNPFY